MAPAVIAPQDFDRALADAIKCCVLSSTSADFLNKDSKAKSIEVRSLAKDLGCLLHSHCTKLSLAARPPQTIEAVDACVLDIYKLLPLFASLSQSLNVDTMGLALCNTIRDSARYALIGLRSMIQTVRSNAVDERLSKTGILWESCLELQKIESLDVLMSRMLRESSQMVNDAIEDLQSFMVDGPTDGFGDDLVDGSDDSESDTASESSRLDSSKNDAEITRQSSMLSRIILLLKAIDKRQITPQADIKKLNSIFSSVKKLRDEVDDLAGEIQECSDPAFIMEVEKTVVHRVEEILDATVIRNDDSKWQDWVKNFRAKWLEETKQSVEP